MAMTKVSFVVRAKCLDDIAEYEFDDIEQARIFSEVAAKWHAARCPKCSQKDSTNLILHGGIALVWCAWSDCDFAKKIEVFSPEGTGMHLPDGWEVVTA